MNLTASAKAKVYVSRTVAASMSELMVWLKMKPP
jgi:hypothetical protein